MAEEKRVKVEFVALATSCPTVIGTSRTRVAEMGKFTGRFVIEATAPDYEEQVETLRRYCKMKPHLLKELKQGVDAGKANFPGKRTSPEEELQEAKRTLAETSLDLSKKEKEVEVKDNTIDALKSKLAAMQAEIDKLTKKGG